MLLAKIEQDIGSLGDHQLAGYQVRRSKGGMLPVLAHIRFDIATTARSFAIRDMAGFQCQPHEFTTSWDTIPITRDRRSW